MEHVYLVVEGPHDVEFIGRLGRPLGLRRIPMKDDVDPFWQKLIPSAFPHLLRAATQHVDGLDESWPEFRGDDLKELKKPAGRHKAIIASAAAVLKPGKAIQVSIQDNRWIDGDALRTPRIHACLAFLS